MTREEFCGLPPSIALGLVYDLARAKLEPLPPPRAPLPPKFDAKIGRKGGFCWASELTLESLEWWLSKKQESVDSGGPYADRDAKTVEALERFVAWRRACPADAWSGTRGKDRVTAAAPSREPELHAWGTRGPAPLNVQPGDHDQQSRGSYSDDDYGAGSDDEIPF